MSHTPGPWKVEDGGFVGGPVGFGRVCQTWNKFEEDFQNAEANARLIAAAPDLLDALRDLLASVDDYCGELDRGWHQNQRHAARDAIAKAEARR